MRMYPCSRRAPTRILFTCRAAGFTNNLSLLSRKRSSAFSLLEVVAVLAILAILAAATLPRLVQQADTAAALKEDALLDVLADGFQKGVVRLRYIPSTSPDDWADLISRFTGWQMSAVQTNAASRTVRVLLADPNLTTSLPYSQTPAGTSAVGSPRFLLVSSMSAPLPQLSGADFYALWTNSETAFPAGAGWEDWKAEGATASDLKVKRIDLSASFIRVSLTNAGSTVSGGKRRRRKPSGGTPATPTAFSVDGSAAVLNPGAGVSGFFLTGTVLDLISTNSAVRQVLNQDAGFVFTNGVWSRQL
jgi:prepilin-type N-terminal cleavage/methylation domain-containing protein